VSSSSAFRLRGVEVKVEGVPQWPMRAGDEVVAGKAPVMVTFQGGSQVYLNAGSRARLAVVGKQNVLRLMSGDLAYKVSTQSPVSVAALGHEALPAESSEGSLSIMNGSAVWAPAGGAPSSTSEGLFRAYRVHPFNMDFVARWKEFEAPFGRPPGTPPGFEEPPIPPGPPPGRPPVSISR
jgi:hypothetical protein